MKYVYIGILLAIGLFVGYLLINLLVVSAAVIIIIGTAVVFYFMFRRFTRKYIKRFFKDY